MRDCRSKRRCHGVLPKRERVGDEVARAEMERQCLDFMCENSGSHDPAMRVYRDIVARSGVDTEEFAISAVLARRDPITWTSLICAYAKNGRGKESLEFYAEMVPSGCRPVYGTFIGRSAFHVQTHRSGLHRQAHFRSMHVENGVAPGQWTF
jgi:pentatricopeptide repeat protein